MPERILLDASFLKTLLTSGSTHHVFATGYMQYFLQQSAELYLSTISAAELSMSFELEALPLMKHIRLLPFNFQDAQLAGALAVQQKKTQPESQSQQPGADSLKVLAQAVTGEVAALMVNSRAQAQVLTKPLLALRGKLPFTCYYAEQPHEAAFGLTGTLFV